MRVVQTMVRRPRALELIVGQLPESALDQRPERSELVRACRKLGVEHSRFRGERAERAGTGRQL